MSEASPRRRSQDHTDSDSDARASRSVPTVSKTDPITLYTTTPDGVPPIMILLLQLARDVLTFFIRGGIGTLTFSMDICLRLIIFVFDTWLQIPGIFLVSWTARFTLWCYQLCIWVAYTAVELLLYIPTPFLVLYVIALFVLYYKMPEEMGYVLRSMLWLGGHFLKLVKNIAYIGPI